MKGWMMSDGEAAVFVRADDEEAATHYWTGWIDDLTTTPFPLLDGPGPEREIEPVREPCADEGYSHGDVCPGDCYEGLDGCERINWPATLARLDG